MRAIEIPASQWQCAESKLQESIVSRATTKFVRQFTYDLHLEKFCGCSAPEAANLFFKCATAQGEDICEKYLVLELRDGAAEQDGRRFNSLQYHSDPLREGFCAQVYAETPTVTTSTSLAAVIRKCSGIVTFFDWAL